MPLNEFTNPQCPASAQLESLPWQYPTSRGRCDSSFVCDETGGGTGGRRNVLYRRFGLVLDLGMGLMPLMQ